MNRQYEQRVNEVIDFMKDQELYVDQFPKAKWINNVMKKGRFNHVKSEVAVMYTHKRGFDWCTRVKYRITFWLV